MQHKQRSERIMQKELLRKSGQTEPRSDVAVRWALYALLGRLITNERNTFQKVLLINQDIYTHKHVVKPVLSKLSQLFLCPQKWLIPCVPHLSSVLLPVWRTQFLCSTLPSVVEVAAVMCSFISQSCEEEGTNMRLSIVHL